MVISILGWLTISSSWASPIQFSLFSWNVWGLPEPIAPDRKERLTLIDRWLPELDADVVAVQEQWSGAVEHLSSLPWTRSEGAGDDGLGISTRWQVESQRSGRFSLERSWDALKSKGWLLLHLKGPQGADLCIINTHLQAGSGAAAGRVRAQQVDELLAATADCDGPSIILGDFNLDERRREDRPALARLTETGWIDGAIAFGSPEGTWGKEGFRFDRVFFRNTDEWEIGLTAMNIVQPEDYEQIWGRRPSDHASIYARLNLTPTFVVSDATERLAAD